MRLPRKIEHRGPQTTGRQRDARDVHHAPCRAGSRAPATQNRAQRRGDHGTPERRQRLTSRLLQEQKVARLPRKIEHRGTETTGRQRDARDVHHAPCRAESRAPATQNRAKGPEPKGRQRYARETYITPRQRDARDVHHAPCRAESRAPATQKARSPRDARGTPETYITPLAEQKVTRLPRV